MGRWRKKRLTDYPMPEALEIAYERAQKMSPTELLVWAETMALNVDRLIAAYKQARHFDTAWDAYHYSLQLTGMTRSLVDRSSNLEL